MRSAVKESAKSNLISYAQNGEDMILHILLHDVKKGFYVDVGANHEELHSVTKFFYERGWNGINIEPTNYLYQEIVAERKRDTNLNIAISNKKGSLKFREYPHHDGFSTLDAVVMKNHEVEGIPHRDYTVKVETLADIFKKQKVERIDFLKIDVEGYEIPCIEGNDWDRYRPRIVIVEATHKEKLIDIFKNLKYKLEFFDGLNLYFVDTANPNTSTIYDYCDVLLAYGYKTIYHKRLEDELLDMKEYVANLNDRINSYEKKLRHVRRILHELRRVKGVPARLASSRRTGA